MDCLCFATFARAVHGAFLVQQSEEVTVKRLLEPITSQDWVKNKNGEPYNITKEVASFYLNRVRGLPKPLHDAVSNGEVVKSIKAHFENTISDELNPLSVTTLQNTLQSLINADLSISSDERKRLVNALATNDTKDYLTVIFLYVMIVPNKLEANEPKRKKSLEGAANALTAVDKYLTANGLKKPKALNPPSRVENMPYVSELLSAYADAEGKPGFTKKELKGYTTYQDDFERQRKNYYAAESIRRGIRDAYQKDDLSYFDELKEETYDGVVDVMARKYTNGYERLNSVMSHATMINVNGCLLGQIPGWINAKEKKGVCHILVNDGRIKWVSDDE
jgi:hypothetical protein